MLDQITRAVLDYDAKRDPQWNALCRDVPAVSYFATDVDPRSFERDAARGGYIGRAELLLKAPAELRHGQPPQEVSFTLPVKVFLREQDGALTVTSFQFYAARETQSEEAAAQLEYGPPKEIGWGPFKGLSKSLGEDTDRP